MASVVLNPLVAPTFNPDMFKDMKTAFDNALANDQAIASAIGAATLNRTIIGDDNTATAVQDTGGNVAVPIPVTLTTPAASPTQLTAGTRSLRTVLQTLANNVAQALQGTALQQSSAACTLASGYTQYSTAYTALTATKIGTVVTLEAGPLGCPASFSANTYYTYGTLPAGFAPAGTHRMGLLGLYTTGAMGIIGCQARINTSGALEFATPSTVAPTGVVYMIPPTGITWRTT